MQNDIFEGIDIQLLLKYDQFSGYINDLLKKPVLLIKTDLYKDIYCFCVVLDDYIYYMGKLADDKPNIIYKIIKTIYTFPFMDKYHSNKNEKK